MPSFDIVSEVDLHELANAVDQTNREITARFDFKDADARVEHTKETLTLHAQNEFQLKQMIDILQKKMAKRGIDIAALDIGQPETQNRRARLPIKIKQGIPQDLAKKITKLIKDSKIKVQAAIQADQVRVSGKKRDELQQVIALLRTQSEDFNLPLQYINFRD